VGVFGVLLVAYQSFLYFLLAGRWGLVPGERGLFFAFSSAVAIVALYTFGKRGEALFRQNPARLLRLSGALLAFAVVLIGLGGLSPWLWGMLVFFATSQALIAIITPTLYM